MKYLLLFALLAPTSVSLAQQPDSSAEVNASVETNVPTVAFCDLLDNPERYNQKIVRTRAVFSRGGEDYAELYCPRCYSVERMVWPTFDDDSFDSSTKSSIRKKFDGSFDVTLSATVVGKFIASPGGHLGLYRHQFLITRAEQAERVSKGFGLPERLSRKVKRRVRC